MKKVLKKDGMLFLHFVKNVNKISGIGLSINSMYICKHCNFGYIYKRCLISHIKKKHNHKKLKNLSD